jgi:hypothetical protein
MADWTTALTFDEEQTFNTDMTEITEVVTSDHTKLINRDAAQQHPIGAITNLSTELSNRVVSGNTLTNEEIEQIIIGG